MIKRAMGTRVLPFTFRLVPFACRFQDKTNISHFGLLQTTGRRNLGVQGELTETPVKSYNAVWPRQRSRRFVLSHQPGRSVAVDG